MKALCINLVDRDYRKSCVDIYLIPNSTITYFPHMLTPSHPLNTRFPVISSYLYHWTLPIIVALLSSSPLPVPHFPITPTKPLDLVCWVLSSCRSFLHHSYLFTGMRPTYFLCLFHLPPSSPFNLLYPSWCLVARAHHIGPIVPYTLYFHLFTILLFSIATHLSVYSTSHYIPAPIQPHALTIPLSLEGHTAFYHYPFLLLLILP